MAMEAQLQIRQNAMEVQEYLSDLFDWEKSMKKAEKKSHTGTGSSTSTVPGPRGRASSSISEAPQELQTPGLTHHNKTALTKVAKPANRPVQDGPLATTAASHTHSSYSKWDKMDVDSMLDSDGEGEGQPKRTAARAAATAAMSSPAPAATSSAAASTAPIQPAIQVHQGAADLVAITTRRATPASTSVSEASSETNGTTPGAARMSGVAGRQHPPVRNTEPQTADAWRLRGNDLFKAGQYAYARDCYTRCTELDPGSAVAFANRAMAELKLSQWAEAEEDCTQALTRDPAFVKAFHRRGVARRHLGQPLLAAQDFEDALRWDPANKALAADRDAALSEHMASAQLPPLTLRTRLPITLTQPQQQQQQQQEQQEQLQQPMVLESGSGPAAAAVVMQAVQEPVAAAAVAQPAAAATPPANAVAPKGDSGGKARLAAVTSGAVQQLASRMAVQMRAPRTSTEFEASWRSLAGDAKAQLTYLSLVPPAQLPSIFKSSLTPQLLSSILEVVLAGVTAAATKAVAGQAGPETDGQQVSTGGVWSIMFALDFLQGLSKVPRVEMASMCIGTGKKGELRAMWEAAFGADSSEAVRRVKASFKL